MNIRNMTRNGSLYYALKTIIESNLGTFPEIGIIAGQAVSSAMMVHLGIKEDQPKPFNDVDIFVTKSIAPYCHEIDNEEPIINEEGNIIKYSSTRAKVNYAGEKGKLKYSLIDLSFSCELLDPTFKNSYSIDYSHRDEGNPLVNYIRIKINNDTHTSTPLSGRAEHILAGFDINACQIALDTATKTVHWTPEFEEFIRTLELKASFLGTPMHTAVRLFKKHAELPFLKLNAELEMLKLQSAREVFIHIENERAKYSDKAYVPGNLFSSAYLPKIESVKDKIEPYFTLDEKICVFDNHYSERKPDSSCSTVVEEKIQRTMYVFTPKNHHAFSVETFVNAFIKSNTPLSCEDVNRLFSIWFDAACEAESSPNSDAATRFFNFSCVAIGSDRKFGKFNARWLHAHINDSMDAFKNTSFSDLSCAYYVYREVPELFELFLSENISLYEIIKRYKNVRWLIHNGFLYYIGFMTAQVTKNLLVNGRLSSDFSSLHRNHFKPLHAAVASHAVPFDNPNFQELMLEKRREFAYTLKKLRSPYTTCDKLNSRTLSKNGLKVNLVSSAFELFKSLMNSGNLKECAFHETTNFYFDCASLLTGEGLFLSVYHPLHFKPCILKNSICLGDNNDIHEKATLFDLKEAETLSFFINPYSLRYSSHIEVDGLDAVVKHINSNFEFSNKDDSENVF